MMTDRDARLQKLHETVANRILILDGAMGTMIQRLKLGREDYHKDQFVDWAHDLKGNMDLLSLTRPDVIRDVHSSFLEADADILETNTFSSTSIAQADYGLEDYARELNVAGARLAREAADAFSTPERPRYVAGTLGPTNRTASISPDVNDPGARNVDFDELVTSYKDAATGLIEGGADLLLVETIFDTLNAKAALFAIDELYEELGVALPLMISVTITDQSGRTLSGQTVEAFWNSVRHAKPFSVGINCALGPDLMRPYIAELSRISDCCVSAHPNAGLPNAFGEYDETAESMSEHLGEWSERGFINIVGGCCGTTPEHVAAIANAASVVPPRLVPNIAPAMRLSGLEPLTLAR